MNGAPVTVATGANEATSLRHGARVVLARRLAFRFEAHEDPSFETRDATDAWHEAIGEVSRGGNDAPSRFPDEFSSLAALDDDDDDAASAAPSDFEAPEVVSGLRPPALRSPRSPGFGESPRKRAPVPALRSPATPAAAVDALSGDAFSVDEAQAQLDAILGAPPAYESRLLAPGYSPIAPGRG